MDHERFPDYAEPAERRARAERAARMGKAASALIATGWTAACRSLAFGLNGAKQRSRPR